MSTNFPAAIDSLVNPAGPDAQALVDHARQHTDANDAIEAIETRIGTDSAPSLARLSGVSGGQTLIGGTGATDKLTLQGTSGTGTAGATALRALVGNAGGTEALSITNEGVVTVGTGLKTNMAGQCAIGPGTGLVDFPSSILTPPPKAQTISGFSRPDDNVVQWANQVLSTTVNPSANLTKWTYGLLSEMVTPVSCSFNTSVLAADYSILKRNGSGTGSLYGKYSFVDNAGINTVTTIQCLGSTGYNSGSGTVTQMWGTEGYLGNTGTGTVTTAICVGAGLSNSAAGTITNAYGVNIGGPGEGWPSAGTVTNAYGLYIGSAVNYGTNKWSIYNGSPAVSYLAGSLALGVTAASAKVHAVATTEQLRLGYDSSNYASFTVNSAGQLKVAAPLAWRPPATYTPAANGDLTVEATSNTTLTFRLKGSDGVVRSASLTLS